MVTFSCDACGDVVKKPRLRDHTARCRAPVSCLDCGSRFAGSAFEAHTSCISEKEKYEGRPAKRPRPAPPLPKAPTDTHAAGGQAAEPRKETPGRREAAPDGSAEPRTSHRGGPLDVQFPAEALRAALRARLADGAAADVDALATEWADASAALWRDALRGQLLLAAQGDPDVRVRDGGRRLKLRRRARK